MIAAIQMVVALLAVIAVIAVLASRLKVPPAILLVIAGIALALIPGLPRVQLAPPIVLLLVLPPVIYSAAVAMSWREFRFNLRPISLLAVGCVVFTTVTVAAALHWLLGFAWPIGFVVGAIVSPPDAVAPLSIARRLGLPRRISVILEGEGLANDATALILYRFAVVAVSVGSFSFGHAVGDFVLIVVGEIAWGLAVGWAMLRLRKWVGNPSVEILLSILTPFIAYWPPETLGGSGVLATVATGLYFSWYGPRLISAATRLQGIFFWSFFTYLIEGMVFLITGLQARGLIGAIHGYPPGRLALCAVVLSAVVIIARFVWIFPATYAPRWISPALRRRDPSPPWQWPFMLGYTGIRGIVSLAAALALPLTIAGGAPFPNRDLILFLTFSVIVVTLVGQGLLLPAVIHWLGLAGQGRRERAAARTQEFAARRKAIRAALARLTTLAKDRGLAAEIVSPLRARHEDRLTHIDQNTDREDARRALAVISEEVELILLTTERNLINDLHNHGALKDEGRRRIEREFDLREAEIANLRDEDG
jgi:CPA1 family monovalent cation:H+ antiporter